MSRIVDAARRSADLRKRFGRGFGSVNLSQMKEFDLLWPVERILQTVSEKLEDGDSSPTVPAKPSLAILASRFPRGSEVAEPQIYVGRNNHGGRHVH